MNCNRYRTMLYLFREGELSNNEAGDLVQHLHACESCRLEKERIDKLDDLVTRVRSFSPTMDSPATLTSGIVSAVRSTFVNDPRLGSGARLFEFFARQEVRIASAFFIILAVGTFLFQYLTLFTQIHSLESAAAWEARPTHAPGLLYSVESARLTKLSDSKELRDLVPSGQYAVEDGKIVVRQRDVASLLSPTGLRFLTSTVASSVLRMDKQTIDNLIEDVEKNAKIITRFGQ